MPSRAISHRRLICLPLDERFDPPMGVFSHGHVQTGDKMSVTTKLLASHSSQSSRSESCMILYACTAILLLHRYRSHYSRFIHTQVPWLMQVSRVDGVTRERVQVSEQYAAAALDKVVGGPLDFRAPSNYCFLPWWMMRALGLQPRDVVDVKLITTVPPGSAAQLRPHSSKFAKEIANPQAVLETELKHYSALTKGSTIAFDYNGQQVLV